MHSPWQSTVFSFPGNWGHLYLVSIFLGTSPSLLLWGGWVAALGDPLPSLPRHATGTARPRSAL